MNLFGRPSDTRRVDELRRLTVLQQLTAKELLNINELLHERLYQKDEIVFEAGDPGIGLFLILSGKVKATPSMEVSKATLLEIGPGEFFGELSLFDESARTATVIATEETRLVALLRTEFFALIQRNKTIGVKVLFELSRTVSRRARQLLMREKHLPSL